MPIKDKKGIALQILVKIQIGDKQEAVWVCIWWQNSSDVLSLQCLGEFGLNQRQFLSAMLSERKCTMLYLLPPLLLLWPTLTSQGKKISVISCDFNCASLPLCLTSPQLTTRNQSISNQKACGCEKLNISLPRISRLTNTKQDFPKGEVGGVRGGADAEPSFLGFVSNVSVVVGRLDCY